MGIKNQLPSPSNLAKTKTPQKKHNFFIFLLSYKELILFLQRVSIHRKENKQLIHLLLIKNNNKNEAKQTDV